MLAIFESSGGYMGVYSELFFLFSIFEIFHNKKIEEENPTLKETLFYFNFIKFIWVTG